MLVGGRYELILQNLFACDCCFVDSDYIALDCETATYGRRNSFTNTSPSQLLLLRYRPSWTDMSQRGGNLPGRCIQNSHLASHSFFGSLKNKPKRESSSCPGRLTERLNRHRLVVHDLENGIQFCIFHHIVNPLREVEQL